MKCDKSFKCHGGTVGYYEHDSKQTKTPMRFSLFLPPISNEKKVPYLLFLSGLTCTEDNFTTKAGAYKKASELGVAIIAPDTSPRGDDIADDDSYDLGQGAGFYLDATQSPWAENFRMESYITKELLPLVEHEFPMDSDRKSISGHSMGGHGALTLYFKYPDLFKSCSAFAPIVAPTKVPWGIKAFNAYLGESQKEWLKHDACNLAQITQNASNNFPILIDQGLDDQFLEEQLKPKIFEEACEKSGQKLMLRQHEGYDHSYFFISSFIDEHIQWHMKYLSL
jgi:S-formylglutathione hydrolase